MKRSEKDNPRSADKRPSAAIPACLLAASLLLCAASSATAHGTSAAMVDRRAVCVAFTYDDGEVMNYAKVTVSAPGSEVPFQSGATDRNGVACFSPDRAGAWRISAGDAMGHLQDTAIEVDEGAEGAVTVAFPAQPDGGLPRSARALFGVGLILAATGSFALYRSFRREKKLRQRAEAANGTTLPERGAPTGDAD